ncbi:pirin family protein, partial [Vibrio parahaemolyticus EKP-021]
TLTIT